MLPSYFIIERMLNMSKLDRYKIWQEYIEKFKYQQERIRSYYYVHICDLTQNEFRQLLEYVSNMDGFISKYESTVNSFWDRLFFTCSEDFLSSLSYELLYIEKTFELIRELVNHRRCQKDFNKHMNSDQKSTSSTDGKISAYGVLGIKPGATVMEVKRAYRTTVKRVHPDNGGSQKEFILAQHAYEFIMNRIQ